MAHWLVDKPFAHRGLHSPRNNIIENSISAFMNAIESGYGIELDVLLSKDKKAIVFHDNSLNRLTRIKGEVINVNSRELTLIPLKGTTDLIPSLSTVFYKCQNAPPILIEIKGDQGKTADICMAVYNDIENYSGNIAVMSFYPEITEYFKEHYPNILCGMVATANNNGEFSKDWYDTIIQIETIKKQNLDFVAYDIKSLPNDTSEHCMMAGIPVLTWTVKTEEDKARAVKYANNIIFEL
jgi:glycerophosphoryl diester phosphodiesterase